MAPVTNGRRIDARTRSAGLALVPILGWREPVTQTATDLGPGFVDQEAIAGDEQGIGVVGQDVALAQQSARKPLVVLVGQQDELG